ncbi:MAG: sigma-E factor negative regulatory protein [Rubrivivax sp.]|jgi:sigma-E factor negative regulatory protein RseA|nr:sigma-E factor negative regulatory protein [Rubrivivax sp.]
MNDSVRKKPVPWLDETPQDSLQNDSRAWLSALADGQADVAPQACKAWRDDARARQTWHAYHLIGDVLRSEDLAHRPARDAAFLASLREKLADEPVVLAPAPATKPRRHAWLVPTAVAAGFVVVAGVLVVSRMSLPTDATGGAMAEASSSGLTRVGNGAVGSATGGRVGEGPVIRNPRLDEYLRAHQSARGGVPVAVPGGELRRVDALGTAAPVDAPR